jgi:predicted regulator of Ras-like GTPase activity (Roadblock/LC7/MglB family)
MADQSDVENALVAAITATLYPDGPAAASLINCAGGPVMVRVYRGWPVSAALHADLSNGIVNVTVFPSGEPRNTTRYPTNWTVTTAVTSTLTVSVAANAATFVGTTAAGQMAGLCVDGATYIYLVQIGDTTALVAAALAAQLIASGLLVQISGATVTIPSAARLFARVEQAQNAYQEARRQKQSFRVSCWCPAPLLRDQVASTIDTAMARTSFLALADGTSARITLAGGATIDQSENANLYRRDLVYAADYATTLTAAQPAMVFGTGTLSSPAGTISPLLG